MRLVISWVLAVILSLSFYVYTECKQRPIESNQPVLLRA